MKMPGTCVWPWKQYRLDQREDAFHLALVVDVFGEDVLVEGIAGRAVDEQIAVFAEGARPFGEELPALFAWHGGSSATDSSSSRVQKMARSAGRLKPSGSNIAP